MSVGSNGTSVDDMLEELITLLDARGLSRGSIQNYRDATRDLKRIEKRLDQITSDDLIQLEKDMRKRLSPFTVKSRLVLMASFLQFALIGPDAPRGVYPDCVARAWRQSTTHKAKGGDAPKSLPEITKGRVHLKDLKEVIKVLGLPEFGEERWSLRNKAMFAFLWDSGARLSEILDVKLADLDIEGQAGRVKLKGKTGTRRDVPLAWSVPYLKRWLTSHPFRSDGQAPLFCSYKAKPLHKTVLNIKFKKVKEILAAHGYRLEDNCTIHSFRHGRAQYAKTREKLSDEQMRQFFGWTRGSQMPSRYGGAADVTDAVLNHWGIDTGTPQKGELPRLLCGCCGGDNPPEVSYCAHCGAPLTDEAAKSRQTQKRLEEQVAELARFKEETLKRLEEMRPVKVEDNDGRIVFRGPLYTVEGGTMAQVPGEIVWKMAKVQEAKQKAKHRKRPASK